MRQLFNWRFVAAIGALAVLALLANALLTDTDDVIDAIVDAEVTERKIDLIEPIGSASWSEGFELGRDGTTNGFIDLTIDDQDRPRIVRIAPGTFGEMPCTTLDVPDSCAIFADMLGDAVVWFSIMPQSGRSTVELPPIVDLQDGMAVFENGWRVPYPPVIKRDCPDEDIPTFSDFLRRFGPDSVSIVDLTTRQVVAVRCASTDDA